MVIKEKINMQRYLTEHERDKYYMSWVRKNGFPSKYQGCINCAMLICFEDCLGIRDPRITRIND